MIEPVQNVSPLHHSLGRPHKGEPTETAAHSTLSKEKRAIENPNKLDESEKQQVRDLEKRDREVRSHENAHMAAAGSLAMGGPQYVYQIGPDGKSYATGGSVQIDTSPGNTPQETIAKARQMKAAALAPADPSAQDIKVASAASSLEAEATKELAAKTNDKDDPAAKADPDSASTQFSDTPPAEPPSFRGLIANAYSNTAPLGEMISIQA